MILALMVICRRWPVQPSMNCAYGSWLYEQHGFPQDYIQALMGHATEEMTEHYQAGHEPKRIEFERVKAELKLPF